MPDSPSNLRNNVLLGIYCSVAAFFLFACQDAVVKWLVASVSVPQILFLRSATIVTLVTLWRRQAVWRELAASPDLLALIFRGCLMLGAWLFFYNAARWLQLAELTVIYYGSPLIVTLLSIPVLGERVPLTRWIATAIGFAGVIIACLPHDASQPVAMAMAGIASVLWALAMLLMRSISGRAHASQVMLSQNMTLLIGCALTLPWLWQGLSLAQYGLIIAIGVGSGLGQFLVYKAAQNAPASVVAPMEYSSLIWAFCLGFLVWGDVPPETVFLGGGLIVLSGLTMLLTERRRGLSL